MAELIVVFLEQLPLEGGLLVMVLSSMGSMLVYTVRTGISPVPSSSEAKSVILEELPDSAEETIYELGSGWGTLAFPLSRQYPDRQVVGFELSPIPWLVSRLRKRLGPVRNLRIHRADFYQTDLGDASVVVCYLYPGAMERLGPKFEAELPPRTTVISNYFAIPGWSPVKVRYARDDDHSPVYVYKTPGAFRHRRQAG